VAPDALVVFEVLSPGNTRLEMQRKLLFYDKYGVEEYYEYDPDNGELSGWLRQGNRLEEVEQMQGWVSPRLGVRFERNGDQLDLFYPDGRKFESYVELDTRAEQERQRAELADRHAAQADQRAEDAEDARQRERQRAEAEAAHAAAAEAARQRLIAQLRTLGVEPEA